MLASLGSESQVTIPASILSKLELKEGDQFEIFENDGMISMIPVAIYPKKYLDELKTEINELKDNIAFGRQPVFNSLDALFNELDKE